MTHIMYDTTDTAPAPIPHDAYAVAGYVGGHWPSYLALTREYPNAHHLSIAINDTETADCLDVEPGDATPAQARGWIERMLAKGIWRPCIYASRDTWENGGMRDELAGYGSRIRRWVADWNGRADVPAGYDAHQFNDHGPNGENYDPSAIADDFFGPPAPPPDPHHYLWFPDNAVKTPWGEINERDRVEHYDGARAHPILYALYLRRLRAQLGWLAGRVLSVAHESDPPNWTANNRGWRYQQLIQRAHGARFA